MAKHTRFHIDLDLSDAAKLLRLVPHLTTKKGIVFSRADVMRQGLRELAKKEKV